MLINSQSLSKGKVLIVGCGDIGRRLAQNLSPLGYECSGLRRHPPQDTEFLRYQACDVSATSAWQSVDLQAVAVIVITMTPSERSAAGYEQAYVQTARHLIAALVAQKAKPRLVVFVSSTAVYGQMDGSWVDELSPTEPDSFSGQVLLAAEAEIQASGFANIIVRFSGIYGPDRNRLIEQVRTAKAANSEHYTNRIHAEDAAHCLGYLIEQHRQGVPLMPIYLASDSAPTPMREVVCWLAQALDVEAPFSETAVNERGNKRCANHRLLAAGFRFVYPDYQAGYSELLSGI